MSMIILTERDEFLLTMYHCDHMRFCAFCDDADCERVDSLNDPLSDTQISAAVESYNLRTFGVTFKDCKKGKCLFCTDRERCERNGAKKTTRRYPHERYSNVQTEKRTRKHSARGEKAGCVVSQYRKASNGKYIKKRVRQWSGGKARPSPRPKPAKQPKPKWVVVNPGQEGAL